jgi:hypothetical protein
MKNLAKPLKWDDNGIAKGVNCQYEVNKRYLGWDVEINNCANPIIIYKTFQGLVDAKCFCEQHHAKSVFASLLPEANQIIKQYLNVQPPQI